MIRCIQISPTALINTLTVLERVSESLLENTYDSDIGSSLAETIETFIDLVVLPEDQEFLDVQTNDIAGTVSCHWCCFSVTLCFAIQQCSLKRKAEIDLTKLTFVRAGNITNKPGNLRECAFITTVSTSTQSTLFWVLFASLLSGFGTKTGRLLGAVLEKHKVFLANTHNDAFPVRQSNRESQTSIETNILSNYLNPGISFFLGCEHKF